MSGTGILTTTFVSCLIGSLAMGLSCGTGCSPAISLFLSAYVVRCKGDTRRSLVSFAQFFLGKAGAVLLVCLTAALTGQTILNADGYLGKYSLGFLMPAFLAGTGIYMIWELARGRDGCHSCHSCGGCNNKETPVDRAPVVGGFIYGLTPCAPLVILAGYALAMNFGQAMVLAVLFSIASAFSPLLLMMLFMKLVVTRMQDEVPKLLIALRWVLSIVVAVLGIYLLARYLLGSPVAITA